MIRKLLIFILSFIVGLQLNAQTCCSAGAPISSSFDIGGASTKSIVFQLGYEYNSVNLLIDNNKKLNNDPRTRNGHNLLFKTDFVLNKNWAFSTFIPLVRQSRTTFSESENATGLGDLVILGQYNHLLTENLNLRYSAGIKFPTGQQYISDVRGVNLSPDMQSGSGTYDFIGRFAVLKSHLIIPNLTNQTSISYRYNTSNPHFGDPEKINGRYFKFGNETQLTSAFSYLFVAKAWFIIPELGFQLRHVAPNQEQQTDAPNSGGYWIRIPLAVQFQPNDQIGFRILAEIPIKQYLEGLQITTDYKVGFQFTYKLDFSKNSDF